MKKNKKRKILSLILGFLLSPNTYKVSKGVFFLEKIKKVEIIVIIT